MKTIEEKAKAYDEIIERAKAMLAAGEVMYGKENNASQLITDIIPELKESEDERIRKALVKQFGGCIKDHEFCNTGFTYAEITAWLEKQKEQKPISSCDIVPYIDDKIAALQDMWRKEKVAFDWDDMKDMIEDVARHFYQKEQKPAIMKPHKGDDGNPYDMGVSEAQEYAIKRGFGIPFNDGEVFVDERYITQTIGNILRWADEHPKEQKPAEWNDTDMKEARNDLISVCRDWEYGKQTTLLPIAAVRARYFLEHLNEPKPAWSEEDEKMLNGIIGRGCSQIPFTEPGLRGEQIDWLKNKLKSLRPQPHWKPSEEQMAVLGRVVNTMSQTHNVSTSGYPDYVTMASLLTDLRELRK